MYVYIFTCWLEHMESPILYWIDVKMTHDAIVRRLHDMFCLQGSTNPSRACALCCKLLFSSLSSVRNTLPKLAFQILTVLIKYYTIKQVIANTKGYHEGILFVPRGQLTKIARTFCSPAVIFSQQWCFWHCEKVSSSYKKKCFRFHASLNTTTQSCA